jgi:hypothetical protein
MSYYEIVLRVVGGNGGELVIWKGLSLKEADDYLPDVKKFLEAHTLSSVHFENEEHPLYWFNGVPLEELGQFEKEPFILRHEMGSMWQIR